MGTKYDGYSKEELIELLLELEQKRAFTYEDQMKLLILDNSPFTVWTSDRNCIIRMWEGQCEIMYGIKKDDAIGKNFTKLIVAPDEVKAAERDQIEIIDNNQPFHNIANDHSKNGNTVQLITNCFRITDIVTGEYLNAEMGVAIDFYEEEKKQLQRNIEEGKLIQSLVSDFSETQRQYREQFIDRKEALLASIRTGERSALKQGKLLKYREKTQEIKAKVQQIETNLDSAIVEYYRLMRDCITSLACSEVKTKFNLVLRKILNDFDEVVIDLELINYDIEDQSSVVSFRDEVMKATTAKNSQVEALASEIWLKAEDEIKHLLGLGKINPKSNTLAKLREQRDQIKGLKDEIHTIGDEIYSQLINATSEDEIRSIKNTMETRYGEVETKLHEIRKGLGLL